jgi:hypothetical protein
MEGGRTPYFRPPVACPVHANQEEVDNSTLSNAIQIIETFVREANWPERVINAWKRVKRAAFQTRTRTNKSSNSSAQKTDLNDIKA